MTTTANLVLAIRRSIPEASAADWLDATIVGYLDLVYKEWCAALGKLPGPGWFTIDATFSMAANVTSYAMTSLLAANVGKVAALKTLYYVPDTGDEVEVDNASPGQESMWRLPVGQSPSGQMAPDRKWITRPAGVFTVNVGPEIDVARNFRAWVRYEPPDLTNTGESVQSDPRHDDLLVRGAVLRALEDVGEADDVVERRFKEDWSRFIDDERMAAGESQSETTKLVVSEAMFGN